MNIIITFIIIFISIFVFPVNNSFPNKINWVKPIEGKIPNSFGNGYFFFGLYRAGHTGIDIYSKVGNKVVSVDNGIVRYIYNKPNKRYGNYIVIEHKKVSLFTLYAHLNEIKVKINQKVVKGQYIGTSGVSGLASYPHLHFEVTNRVPINDGAWGYNYICNINKTQINKISNNSKKIFEYVINNYNFINRDKVTIKKLYRMKDKICIEKKIFPITYYNPEKLLPKYSKSKMLKF